MKIGENGYGFYLQVIVRPKDVRGDGRRVITPELLLVRTNNDRSELRDILF